MLVVLKKQVLFIYVNSKTLSIHLSSMTDAVRLIDYTKAKLINKTKEVG